MICPLEFYGCIQKKLIGFASDGAPANIGQQHGTIKYIRDWASNPVFSIYCMAHKLKLAVQHAFESLQNLENMNKISEYL